MYKTKFLFLPPIAILSAQPTDVVKIRMQAELRKPGEKSRYNGVWHAYTTVFKEEGFAGKICLFVLLIGRLY